MSTTPKPSQNGTTAKPVETLTNGKEQKPVATTVPVAPLPLKKETHKEPADQPPLEDRIFKVQQLTHLIDKRDKLQESLRKLNAFKLSTDGRNDELRIEDGEGNEFFTTNSAAIGDVVSTLKASIQSKLLETEALILF